MTFLLSALSWCAAHPALAVSRGVLLLSVAYVLGLVDAASKRA
jgi:hypothetical protein